MERMIRRWKSLTAQQVQKLFDESTPAQYAHGGLGGGEYMPPLCEELTGKHFRLSFEQTGETYDYQILDKLTLEWSVSSQPEKVHTEYQECLKSENGVYLLHHIIKGSVPPAVVTMVLDFNTGLVTMVRAHFGNESEAREVARSFLFGTICGYASYPNEKHHFTGDLVGKAINWVYHVGMNPIKHIYSTEYYYTYVMEFDGKCWVASNPADFVKINDHLYIFSFLEERQSGTQGLFLINTDTLHDIGSFTGINNELQFESYLVGAKGEWATMETHLM